MSDRETDRSPPHGESGPCRKPMGSGTRARRDRSGSLGQSAPYPRDMTAAIRLLLVSGSTRPHSTNTAALRTLREVAPPEVQASLYSGLTELPAFIPDQEAPPPPTVEALRREVARADGVVFCTPEYAGSLPGSLKNLLDWTVGSGELYGKPVAWINVAAEGRGTGAEATMATVLGYVGAQIITQACVRIPVPRETVAEDGAVRSDELRARFAEILAAIVEHLNGPAGA